MRKARATFGLWEMAWEIGAVTREWGRGGAWGRGCSSAYRPGRVGSGVGHVSAVAGRVALRRRGSRGATGGAATPAESGCAPRRVGAVDGRGGRPGGALGPALLGAGPGQGGGVDGVDHVEPRARGDGGTGRVVLRGALGWPRAPGGRVDHRGRRAAGVVSEWFVERGRVVRCGGVCLLGVGQRRRCTTCWSRTR